MTTGRYALLVEPSTSTWISKVAILKVTVLLNTELLTSNGRAGKTMSPFVYFMWIVWICILAVIAFIIFVPILMVLLLAVPILLIGVLIF